MKGALCISTSIPSMSRTIYGHHQRFLDTYYNPFKGKYHWLYSHVISGHVFHFSPGIEHYSDGINLGHQLGGPFLVLEHSYGRLHVI